VVGEGPVQASSVTAFTRGEISAREPRQLVRLDGEVAAAADTGWGHEVGRAGAGARKCGGEEVRGRGSAGGGQADGLAGELAADPHPAECGEPFCRAMASSVAVFTCREMSAGEPPPTERTRRRSVRYNEHQLGTQGRKRRAGVMASRSGVHKASRLAGEVLPEVKKAGGR
jgi:hypothetical protein